MNSSVTQHSGDVFSCMLNIQHALKKHDTYKNNYQGMMQLPIVRKLKEQNKRLKQQIRALQESLPEPNVKCSKRSVLRNSKSDNTLQMTEKLSDSEAKKKLEEDSDDDVVIISDTTSVVVIKIEKTEEVKPKNKVVYELIETEKKVLEEVDVEEEEVVVEEVEIDEEEEVVVEEVEIDEEEEEEEVVVEEEKDVEVVEEEEEEEEYEEVTINGVDYCTCDKENGSIFELNEDGEIGEEKGIYKNGKPCMHV